MPAIKAIPIGENQYLYVEVDTDMDDSNLPVSKPSESENWRPSGPEYASPTGVVEDTIDALKSLQQNIEVLAETV
ncbi:MAG: hypothetical protein ACU843_11080, partial [Gammaproteobacteria bacterium]